MSNIQKEWIWSPLPTEADLETPKILKKALEAQQYVSELKGISYTIPQSGYYFKYALDLRGKGFVRN